MRDRGELVAAVGECPRAASPPHAVANMLAAAANAALLRGVAAWCGEDCACGHDDEPGRLGRRRRGYPRCFGDCTGSASAFGGVARCAGRRDPDGRFGRQHRCARRRRNGRCSRCSCRSRGGRPGRRGSRSGRAPWAVWKWSAGGRHSVHLAAITPRDGRLLMAARRHSGGRPWWQWPRWRWQRPHLCLAVAKAARRVARTEIPPRRERRPPPRCGGTGG